MYSGCLWAACVDLSDTLCRALSKSWVPNQPDRSVNTLLFKVYKIPPTVLCLCEPWYALLPAYTRDKLLMEQLVAHIILLMCLSLVVPSALSTFWWFRNSKAIISSVPPLPTRPVSPIPLTPPIISVPPASISVTTVAVAAAAAAVSVPIAVPISFSMAFTVPVAIFSTASVASVAVAVVTVFMAAPVIPVSVPWAVSLWGRSRRGVAVLWTGLTGGNWAQGASAGEAGHGHGDALGPFWTIRGLRRHRAQAAGTGPAWRAAGLGAELWRAAGCSHKVTLILSLEEKET